MSTIFFLFYGFASLFGLRWLVWVSCYEFVCWQARVYGRKRLTTETPRTQRFFDRIDKMNGMMASGRRNVAKC